MKDIIQDIEAVNGKAYQVGGCVRDHILNVECKDIDVEVFNISMSQLETILASHGKVDLVGKQFGILKFSYRGREYDFSVPRKESSVGVGHKDFNVELCPNISIEEACSRRDFTMNAVMMDFYGNIVDPFNGLDDIRFRILRHTSDNFSDDPLRVLRGMQFAARFNMEVAPETYTLCRNMLDDFHSLSPSRLYAEFEKFLLKGQNIMAGLTFLNQTFWVRNFPAIKNICMVAQNPEWHPEGDVLIHTGHVCNAMRDICHRESITGDDKMVLMLSALLHDVGKAVTTFERDGKIVSPGHAEAGVPIAKEFLDSILCPHHIRDRVLPLVKEHMFMGHTERAVKRLSKRLGKATIRELLLLMEADVSGRPPLPKRKYKHHDTVVEIAEKFNMLDESIKPLVMGRHLMGFVKSGPVMGKILKELFEKQMNGEFKTVEEGVAIARKMV